MIKLKNDFQATIDLSAHFPNGGWLIKLMPMTNGRAIAFGVGRDKGASLREEGYWLADISREGVAYRILPPALTTQLNTVFCRGESTGTYEMLIQAFKFGEGFGLLVGSQFVYLFDDIHAEARMLEIENHFTHLRELNRDTPLRDRYFIPLRCGNSESKQIPVMFSAPEDNLQNARYLSLLDIDEQMGKATWLHTQPNGRPRCTVKESYFPYSSNKAVDHIINRPPIIYDAAWQNHSWILFIAGFDHVYPRSGIKPSILTRNSLDLSLLDIVLEPVDESLAHFCASMDRLIVSPYRKNGSRKGKQTIYDCEAAVEHDLGLPRGYTKFSLLEYYDNTYWLSSSAMGYNGIQFDVVTCHEG